MSDADAEDTIATIAGGDVAALELELRRVAQELLGALPHVPRLGSRLAWEARARVERELLRKVR